MVRPRPRALAVLAGALLFTLGACSTTNSPGQVAAPGATTPAAAPASAVPASAAAESAAPAGNAPASTAPPAATPSVIITTVTGNTSFFITPSKNIGCAVAMTDARCDIGDRSWTTPPKPASCMLDYGNGMDVNANGAVVSCEGDTVLNRTQDVLQYGYGIRNGQMQCISQSTGVTCEDVATGHGFTLAKEAYTVF
jgi:hypothetical protein